MVRVLVKMALLCILIWGIFWLTGCKNETPIGKWRKGIIPYYLVGEFTDDDIAVIIQAMNDWEEVAGVDFKEVTPRAGAYSIRRISETSWSSSVGENNSDCYMIFGNGSNKYAHVIHELGHALGLLHEHQRPDRDNYVEILWDYIIPFYKKNFEIQDNPLIIEEAYPYDFHSIMHYPSISFSINGSSDTIQPRDTSQQIDRTGVITATDAKKAVEIYGPPRDSDDEYPP